MCRPDQFNVAPHQVEAFADFRVVFAGLDVEGFGVCWPICDEVEVRVEFAEFTESFCGDVFAPWNFYAMCFEAFQHFSVG